MRLTTRQILSKGIAAHKDGKFNEAEKHYKAILQSDSAHPHANHNLGVLCVNVDKLDDALLFFDAALKSDSSIEQFWISYIEALINAKQLRRAEKVLKKAKRKKIKHAKLKYFEAELVNCGKTCKPARRRPAQQQLDQLIGHYQNGRLGEAEKLANSLIKEFPRTDLVWMIKGAIYETTGRLSEALNAHKTALDISPNNAQVHYNLGITLQAMEKHIDSKAAFIKAIALKPDFFEALTNLGATQQKLKQLEDAEVSFRRAINLKPNQSNAHNLLGGVLTEQGKMEEASVSYKRAIELDPECPFSNHMYAALTGKTTSTAPREYVVNLFDKFAGHFESTLVGDLEYNIPKRLAEIIIAHSESPSLGTLLDLGCGTGLFGSTLNHAFTRLSGVDLSSKMLAEAKEKRIYDNLIEADITDFLLNENLNFNYFVSTDVFVYIGDLSEIFHLIASRNNKDGKFAFSTEHIAGDGFRLEQSGRYSHSKKYIDGLCEEFGFTLSFFETRNLRKENHRFITGGLYLLDFNKN